MLKFSTLKISTEDAATQIIEHSSISQTRIAFKKVTPLYEYFKSILSGSKQNIKSDHGSKIILFDLLIIVLIAFGYIEPFFEKDENTSNEFAKLIDQSTVMLSSLKNNLF